MKKSKGFTLLETLIVVGILVILFAIGTPALLRMQKELRQTELDSKAEAIYAALQNHLTILYTGGRSAVYDPQSYIDGSVQPMGTWPGDYDAEDSGSALLNDDSVYYFGSGSSAAERIITSDVIDDELSDGHYVIEYIPYAYRENTADDQVITAAMVYAVYYSESRADVSAEYGTENSNPYLSRLRVKSERLKDGARVGYYGGSVVGSAALTSTIVVNSVVIYSEDEIMTAASKVKKPVAVSDPLVVELVLSDYDRPENGSSAGSSKKGNSYSIFYWESTGQFYQSFNVSSGTPGALYTAGNIVVNKVGRTYNFKLILDDLSSETTRFKSLYGDESGHNENGIYTDRELNAGTMLKLQVYASCPTDHTVDQNGYGDDIGNSLFSEKSTEDTAIITCGRHLQNLSEESHVVGEITHAVQNSNVSFSEDSEWIASYETAYWNGMTEICYVNQTAKVKVPNFKPIVNDQLVSFAGSDGTNRYSIAGLTVNASDHAGLFKTLGDHDMLIDQVTLTGTRITSANGNAGAAAGEIKGDYEVTIRNTQVLLSRDADDIPDTITEAMNVDGYRFISGKNAGGLVGANEGVLVLQTSSASTILSGQTAGGLVGRNSGELSCTYSYADSYLYGENSGGLVGLSTEGEIEIASCYAAGFIGLTDEESTGAGLVNGDVSKASDSYTIVSCYYEADDHGIDKSSGKIDSPTEGNYYSTASSIGEVSRVFYFSVGSSDDMKAEGTAQVNDMTSADLLAALGGSSTGFQINTVGTQPYKLMGQSLTTYTYPRLSSLDHYGDWEAEFRVGGLVYYEKYEAEDGSSYFGFDGAGVDITLTGEDTIKGDGYGIVFRADESAASEIRIRLNGNEYFINPTEGTEGVDFYLVNRMEEGKPVSYRIYPLPKEEVNPLKAPEQFYTRVEIRQSIGGTDSFAYYDFNPHFARTVLEAVSEDAETPMVPNRIGIRSPRQLYNLSLYYEDQGSSGGYRSIAAGKTYRQERDLIYSTYDWTTFSRETDIVRQQMPIGSDENSSFRDTYDGGCYMIGDVSFISEEGRYVGMFGYASSEAVLKNIVLGTIYDKTAGAVNYRVQRTKSAVANERIFYGTLAGYNAGTINNCASAGYYLSGADGTIHGYANSQIYAGGLVGFNSGAITKSSSDNPRMSLSMYRTTCYAGGFVGWNEGMIRNSYSLGHLDSDAQGGNTIIAGFAAHNIGTIRQAYCATALTAAGDGSESYGFGPTNGGVVSNSYYLHAGSYQYVDGLYAFETMSEQGMERTYAQLVDLNNKPAVNSYLYQNTKELNPKESQYPYTAYVTDANGKAVHYGEWQVCPQLGTVGIFYWEHEVSGQNNGYKLTYIGSSEGSSMYQTTLCTSHDDGGYISEYGYGYYVMEGEESKVSYTLTDLETSGTKSGTTYTGPGKFHTEAQVSLMDQIPGYTFYPYVTTTDKTNANGYIYLSAGTGRTNNKMVTNGTWNLRYNGQNGVKEYKFLLTPFFANAMQYQGAFGSLFVTDAAGNISDYSKVPGSSENHYEIRSAQQLQYINWNASSKSTAQLVTASNYTQFTYLMQTNSTGQAKQTEAAAYNNTRHYFTQSHDLNADSITNFTPIAGQDVSNTSNDKGHYETVLYAWFGSNYDGQNYKISELNMTTESSTTGLFGVTAGGVIENMILYSTKHATIKRSTPSRKQTSYAIGGLIGVAYQYQGSSQKAVINNCAIAGYRIVDESSGKQALGEANVGGLIGVADVTLNNCSAVVDLLIDCNNKPNGSMQYALWGNYIRVGGLAGAAQSVISNCYTGGSIEVSQRALSENKTYTYARKTYVNRMESTNIHLSGIAGSSFAMNIRNFTNSTGEREGEPSYINCYTYMKFPAFEGTIRGMALIGSLADRYNQGANKVTMNNCYYLSSSANIDVSKAPNWTICTNDTGGGDVGGNTIYAYVNNAADFDEMLRGGAKTLARMHLNQDRSAFKDGSSINDLQVRTYDQLRTAAADLNKNGYNSFGYVTTVDASGGRIDGKYSFGAIPSLSGKNYPFPTVLKQRDLTFHTIVNVHYGEWPIDGAYWEKGTDNFDIFDVMSDDGYAYRTYLFFPNGDERIGGAPNFVSDNASIASIGSVLRQTDGSYLVTVRSENIGTVTITETKTSADFTLEMTANMAAAVDPQSMTLSNGAKQDIELTASSIITEESEHQETAKDYSVDDNLIWEITPSDKHDEDGDCLAEANRRYKNIYTITGYGFDASLTIRAVYNYHGHEFYAIVMAVVNREGVVGLSDGSRYNQTVVHDDDAGTLAGTTVEYSGSSNERPIDTTGSPFFLYDTEASELIDGFINGSVTVIPSISYTEDGIMKTPSVVFNQEPADGYEGFVVKTANNMNLSDLNDFRVLPGTYEYRTNDAHAETIEDMVLTFTIRRQDGTIYVLTLDSLKAVPRKPAEITYINNPVCWTASDNVTVSAKTGENYILPECPESFKNAAYAYAFDGWNTEADGNGTAYRAGETIVPEDNLTLYAQWKFVPHTITFKANGGQIYIREGGASSYKLTLNTETVSIAAYTEATRRDGYTLAAWSLTANGETVMIQGEELLSYEFVPTAITENLEVNAVWAENRYSLTLDASKRDGNDVTLTDESLLRQTMEAVVTTGSAALNLPETYRSPVTEDGMILDGWFTENGEKLLHADKDGSISLCPNVSGYTDQYGRWIHGGDPETVTILYAGWACPISFVLNGGRFTDEAKVPDRYIPGRTGETILPETSDLEKTIDSVEYSFLGWYEEADFSGDVVTEIPEEAAESLTYYAKWIRKYVSITLMDDEKVILDGSSDPTENGSDKIDRDAKNGRAAFVYEDRKPDHGEEYILLGWYLRQETTNEDDEIVYTAGQKILDQNGKFVKNISGITDENGLMTETQEMTLYALWGDLRDAESVYVLTDTLKNDEDSEYLIVNGTASNVLAFREQDHPDIVLSVSDGEGFLLEDGSEAPAFIRLPEGTDYRSARWNVKSEVLYGEDENGDPVETICENVLYTIDENGDIVYPEFHLSTPEKLGTIDSLTWTNEFGVVETEEETEEEETETEEPEAETAYGWFYDTDKERLAAETENGTYWLGVHNVMYSVRRGEEELNNETFAISNTYLFEKQTIYPTTFEVHTVTLYADNETAISLEFTGELSDLRGMEGYPETEPTIDVSDTVFKGWYIKKAGSQDEYELKVTKDGNVEGDPIVGDLDLYAGYEKTIQIDGYKAVDRVQLNKTYVILNKKDGNGTAYAMKRNNKNLAAATVTLKDGYLSTESVDDSMKWTVGSDGKIYNTTNADTRYIQATTSIALNNKQSNGTVFQTASDYLYYQYTYLGSKNSYYIAYNNGFTVKRFNNTLGTDRAYFFERITRTDHEMLYAGAIPTGNGLIETDSDEESDEAGGAVVDETETEAEGETEAETETGSESEAETEEGSETESESEAETEDGAETENESETESETETESESETETESGSETEGESEAEIESESEAETEVPEESESEAETEVEAESETESESESIVETESESEAETEAEVESGSEAFEDTEPESSSDETEADVSEEESEVIEPESEDGSIEETIAETEGDESLWQDDTEESESTEDITETSTEVSTEEVFETADETEASASSEGSGAEETEGNVTGRNE